LDNLKNLKIFYSEKGFLSGTILIRALKRMWVGKNKRDILACIHRKFSPYSPQSWNKSDRGEALAYVNVRRLNYRHQVIHLVPNYSNINYIIKIIMVVFIYNQGDTQSIQTQKSRFKKRGEYVNDESSSNP